MRYVYIALIVIISAVVLLFKFQNLDNVTVSFLTMSITVPISLLVIGIYILGMLTGGSLYAFFKTIVRKAKIEEKK
jgi:lipopolysaccharide assembly protein A